MQLQALSGCYSPSVTERNAARIVRRVRDIDPDIMPDHAKQTDETPQGILIEVCVDSVESALAFVPYLLSSLWAIPKPSMTQGS